MATRTSKQVSLAEAATRIDDGARIALGGFSVYQRPMAFVRELIRQGRRNLTVVGVVNGPEVDMLAGSDGLNFSHCAVGGSAPGRPTEHNTVCASARDVQYRKGLYWTVFGAVVL